MIYDDITVLGAIFGVPEMAAELNADLRLRAEAARLDETAEAPVIAMVQIYDGTLYALTGTYYRMVVDAIGFENVFDDRVGDFAEISAEEVLTLAPDVIAVAYEYAPDAEQRAIDEAGETLASSPAALNDRIVAFPSYGLGGGGVSVFDVIDLIAATVDDL